MKPWWKLLKYRIGTGFKGSCELDSAHFEASAGKTDNVTIIEITVFKGRSFEAKKKLYRLIIEKLGQNPGISSEDIIIVLLESPLENWSIKEGRPASCRLGISD